MSILSFFRLDGRTALVTGSSRGIGRAIALALAEAGADVIVHSGGDAKEANGVASQVDRLGRRACISVADLADPKSPAAIAGTCRTFAPALDILVLNAAMQIRRPWAAITPEEARAQIEVNFVSSLALMQALVPPMQERGWGRVLIVGSIQDEKPHSEMAVYAATKGALANLVRNVAKQVSGAGVTVNMISPGVVLTDRNADVLANDDFRAQVLTGIPAGRLGRPIDCAAATLLLCSDAGAFITGVNLPVDGGGRLV